jgi:hypothetical protein
VHDGAVHLRPPTARSIADRLGGLNPVIVTGALVAAFLATRLPFLDADIPQWELTTYSPLDEFGYTVPAFNLLHYGTWVHQAAPWAPLEGPPINAVQNLVAAATMVVFGNSYWGLRASSVLFGLVTFLALIAIIRRQTADARRFDAVPARLAGLVVAAACVLLLVDFSFLLSARIVEPTVTRLAAAAGLVALVAQGVFLGDRHGPTRSAVFGAAVTASVLFVYVYNAFLVPAAFVTIGWVAYRSGGQAALVRHGLAFLAGCVAATAAFFVLIFLVYRQSPVDWYQTWIAAFATTSRGSGFSLSKLALILEANIFRLDPAFVGVVLASLPVFAWTLLRRPTAWMVLIAACLVTFLAQSAVVADYPERKFIMVMLFALPTAASGVLGWRAFQAWTMADHRRIVGLTVWLTGALAVTALATPLGRNLPHGSLLARIILVGGIAGIAALVAILLAPRPGIVPLAAVGLALAIVAPLAYADVAFVYRRPTFSYRDAQIAVGPTIDGQVTAGSLSFGMQLYNSSRPVLGAYSSRIPPAEYDAAVVRFFREGRATSMFSYVNPAARGRWESIGFRLIETYPTLLPQGDQLGRYVLAGPSRTP